MLRIPILALVILTLAIMACGGSITLPDVPTPGPTVVDQISVPAPAGNAARLKISFGAGKLDISPGADQLVEGTAEYNVEALKPEIETNGSDVEIKQGDALTLIEPRGIESTWNLKLGDTPMDLTVNAGAYEGTFELGGLALTGLTIKDGAASVGLTFSKANPSSMQVFRYETGASKVTLGGLANANFSTMIFSSGAGDYELDFDGALRRDATVTVTTGLSNLKLVVPTGITASLTAETGLANIDVGPAWTKDGNRYIQSGSGPSLTFIIKGGAGNLTITH